MGVAVVRGTQNPTSLHPDPCSLGHCGFPLSYPHLYFLASIAIGSYGFSLEYHAERDQSRGSALTPGSLPPWLCQSSSPAPKPVHVVLTKPNPRW